MKGQGELPGARDDGVLKLQPNRARAGVGGIGGGTGLVALAQAIGTDRPLGAIVLYVAPTFSVTFGVLLYYVEAQIGRFLERRRRAWRLQEVADARSILEQQLASNQLSVEHKGKIRALLEELEESVALAEFGRIRALYTTMEGERG